MLFEKIYKLREKKVIKAIANWQKTIWYPVAFALLGAIASNFGAVVYVPIFWLFAIAVIFSALFCDDLKVVLVPIMLIYYALGSDTSVTVAKAHNFVGDSEQLLFGMFYRWGFINIIVAGVLMAACIAYRLIVSGAFEHVKIRGLFFPGLLCLAVSSVLNGAFSPLWTWENLAFGLLEGVGFLITYLLVVSISDKTENLVKYVCKVMVVLGFMISLEIIIQSFLLYFQDPNMLFIFSNGKVVAFNRTYRAFSWGIYNLSGAVLALAIPAAMYLAHSERFGVFYHASAVGFLAVTVWSNCRTAMLMGAVALVACAVLCWVSGPNKKTNSVFSAGTVVGATATLVMLVMCVGGIEEFLNGFNSVMRVASGDSGRFELWQNGWEDFLSAPAFGVGFLDGGFENQYANIYSRFYHNLGAQLVGSMGVVGVLAYLVHLIDWFKVAFRKFSARKLILCGYSALAVAMSLIDNYMWYLNVLLLLGMFFAITEQEFEKTEKTLTL